MKPAQKQARRVVFKRAQMPVQEAAGDKCHESARYAVACAVADDDEIAAVGWMEPEEIATDDVPRFPRQKVVPRHRRQSMARRRHRRLNAASVTQAFQDETVRLRNALLVVLKLGNVAVYGDGSATADSTLADLNPAAVRPVLDGGGAGVAMSRQAFLIHCSASIASASLMRPQATAFRTMDSKGVPKAISSIPSPCSISR